MKRAKLEILASLSRLRLLQLFMGVVLLYLLFMSFEIPLVFRTGFRTDSDDDAFGFLEDTLPGLVPLESGKELSNEDSLPKQRMRQFRKVSGLVFNDSRFDSIDGKEVFSELHKEAKRAWVVGKKLWDDLDSGKITLNTKTQPENRSELCSHSISLSGNEFRGQNRVLVLPCGLTLWSHITVVGTPRWAHPEYDPKISLLREGDESVMVSQFMMELQGLKTVDGEDPPRILHFNPRLKGDWSGKPVIEQNTCYRMQWGSALRCEGWKSRADDETVDGQVKCEKWIRDDNDHSEESKITWWLSRLIGRTKKVSIDWPYPFAEGKLFVLTLSAGLEGYHVNVDGRHVTSFPYRTVRTVAAKYIMKCDDDTFVRLTAVIKEVRKVDKGRSLYIGNMNYHHKPLRHGKWAVTYEEWPEEDYPPYANGPGYILSSDISQFIISEFEKQNLRLFKMEDVSVGMWVEQFNSSRPVQYLHSLKFCQFGCIEDYYTAHYQSPRQMTCLWDKLQSQGKAKCCNMR
ncbi:hypothetical protein I3760_06G080100 [Carya illinoinensis]|nr:hypothetical protein I3760_06G080100 [Carya illinoinensis]